MKFCGSFSVRKKSVVMFAIVALTGCTSVNVKPVEEVSTIKHVCIKECPEDCFVEDMLTVIEEGFERNGVSTERFVGNDPPADCEYHLKYSCNRGWDFATYMTHAELRLLQGRKLVGSAVYHLVGGGGFSVLKWQGTKTKMDPVIDELLGKKRIGD